MGGPQHSVKYNKLSYVLSIGPTGSNPPAPPISEPHCSPVNVYRKKRKSDVPVPRLSWVGLEVAALVVLVCRNPILFSALAERDPGRLVEGLEFKICIS
jgi:hypothetical protein